MEMVADRGHERQRRRLDQLGEGETTSATTTSVSISLGGSGTVLNKMPPGIVVPYILRVI